MQRYEIVNGTTEVQKTKKRTAVDQEGDKAREGTSQKSNSNYSSTTYTLVFCRNVPCTVEKGVPCFWAIAMKNDEVLAQKVGNLTNHFF